MASLGGLGGAPMTGGGGGSGRGLLESLTPLAASATGYKGKPATGTGIQQLIDWAKPAGLLNRVTLHAIVPNLAGAFGGYPADDVNERAPDALFIALFSVLFVAFTAMWVVNTARKQNFHLFLGISFYCAMKIIGFSCRLAWSKNVARLACGVCSLVFIQVAPLVLLSMNMVLAHRIFIWRHPEIGHHWTVVQLINSIYFIVISVIVMAILGQGLPYLYFLGEHHYNMCKNVMKAAAVLNLIYACLPLLMLVIAYVMPVGTIFKTPKIINRFTGKKQRAIPLVYQASWIKSASLFYYPGKNTQVPLIKGEPGCDAVRIIPSREPPGGGLHQVGEKMHPMAPHLHWATLTVTVTTLALILNVCFRVAACFHTNAWAQLDGQKWKVNHWVHEPYVMFIFFGAIEVVVLVFYLLMRIDLRFYIPDRARKRGPNDPPQQAWLEGNDIEKSYSAHDSHSSHEAGGPLTTDGGNLASNNLS